MDGEPGRPEAELAKNGDGGGDLSRPGLLRCWGGGPREAVTTKGSRCSWATGRRGQREAQGRAVVWHAEAEEEKGKRGVQLNARERRKEKGGGGLAAWRRVEKESLGGWPARRAAGGGGGRSASAA
jgi:hypothetical protein